MTIRIADGRSSLWRYDTGVQIQLLGCSHATECHFVAPGGVIRRDLVDGVCDVPDAALTAAGTLTIYAFERNPDGGTTRHSFRLLVQDRPKPADYVDPPDEMDNLQALAERVALLIPGGGGTVTPEQIGKAVEDYLTENPVQVQETDPTVGDWAKQLQKPAYTAEEVGAQPAGDYVLKSEIPVVSVQSVNGKTGDVELAAGDVGALPADAEIVDKTARQGVAELSEEIGGLKESVDNFFADAGTSANILPPDSEAGYFDLETGEPLTSSNHVRTPAPIPLEAGHANLYITSNITSTTDNVNAVVMWLDASGNLLSYKNVARSAMQGKSSVGAIPSNATQFHVWLKGSSLGYSLANLCISYEELPAYEAYVAAGAKVIKAESLDPAALKTFAPLYKKKIVNFGDSIYGKRRPPEDISTELAVVTGAIVYNCGFGGCRMAQHSIEQYDAFSMYRLAHSIAQNDWTLQDAAIAQETWEGGKPSYFAEVLAMLKGIDFNEVDIVTIAYGTNDFTGNIALENAENAQDTASFAGALRYSIETLLTAYPHLKIFVCSQVWRFWMDSGNAYTEDSDTHTNSHGVKLPEFVEKTEAVSKEYHLPYIDTYYSTGFNKFNRGMYFSTTDGTHPLTTGLHVIAHVVARSLY